MARKVLRKIRPQSKRKPRQKRRQASTKVAAQASAQVPQSGVLEKRDIAAKLIPLSLLSAKEAQKAAEKTVDQVLAAITHALTEGDVTIADFGKLKAAKIAKTGEIRISFTPYGKLKQAVEARLNTPV